MKTSYYARLIKDLAVTFNFTPLTIKEIAAYWKRSAGDINRVAARLERARVLKFNKNNELVLTSEYKKFFRRDPATALAIAAKGF